MVTFGFLSLAGSMGLGIYGLAHRGVELVVGVAMVALVVLGLWAILHGTGL